MSVDMRHMVLPSKFNHYYRTYILEGRDKVTGNLDFTVKLPFMEASEHILTTHFFNNNDSLQSASQEQIAQWYNDQGIFFRVKTW